MGNETEKNQQNPGQGNQGSTTDPNQKTPLADRPRRFRPAGHHREEPGQESGTPTASIAKGLRTLKNAGHPNHREQRT
jgi:hypothetical protein